jgi:hypothetical protein
VAGTLALVLVLGIILVATEIAAVLLAFAVRSGRRAALTYSSFCLA